MRCPGLHCPGCRDGGGLVLVVIGIVAAAAVGAWLAAHVWEVIAVTAACAVLAVAAAVALSRWADRRGAPRGAERPFLVAREVPAAVSPAGRPALEVRELHIHLDGLAPAAEQVQVIRRALGDG